MQLDEIISNISLKINQYINEVKRSPLGHEWYMLESGISLFTAKCKLEDFQEEWNKGHLLEPKAHLLQDYFSFLVERMKLIRCSPAVYGAQQNAPANGLGIYLAKLICDELHGTVHMAQLLNPDLLYFNPSSYQFNNLYEKTFDSDVAFDLVDDNKLKERLQAHLRVLMSGFLADKFKTRFIELLHSCPLVHWHFVIKAAGPCIPLYAHKKTWEQQLDDIVLQDSDQIRIELLVILHQYIQELRTRRTEHDSHFFSSYGYSRTDKIKAAKLMREFLLSGYDVSNYEPYIQGNPNNSTTNALKQGKLFKIHAKLIELSKQIKDQYRHVSAATNFQM